MVGAAPRDLIAKTCMLDQSTDLTFPSSLYFLYDKSLKKTLTVEVKVKCVV